VKNGLGDLQVEMECFSLRKRIKERRKRMIMKSHIAFKGIEGRETKIEYKTLVGQKQICQTKNIMFWNMNGDFLLGYTNLLEMYCIKLTLKKELVNISLLE
jgi:hypothetical protein